MRRNRASIFNENVTHYGRAATPHGKKTDIVIFAPTREITLFSTRAKPIAPQLKPPARHARHINQKTSFFEETKRKIDNIVRCTIT